MLMGANPRPEAEQQIQMLREDLKIKIGLDRVDIQAEFIFKNLGKASRLRLIAFPCEPGKAWDASLTCKTRLKVLVDGRRQKVKRIKRALKDKKALKEHFLSWKMRFPAGEEVKLRLEYKARIRNERYSIALGGISFMRYRLGTGALWAGPIAELNIDLETPIDAIALILPSGYRRSPGHISWSFKEYEPKGDLLIAFPFMAGSRNLSAYGKGERRIKQGIKEGRLDPEALKRVIANMAGRKGRYRDFLESQVRYLADPKPRLPPEATILKTCFESIQLLEQRVRALEPPTTQPFRK